MSTATRILVVEDEGVVAKDLQARLRKLGYDVPVTVQTGEAAVEAAETTRPNLILMDVRLKGDMDGIEASARIMEKFRTPVIFLTAYADDNTLGRAKLTEPFGFILKPFNERELHTAIQVALHRHSSEAALRKSERWLAGTLRSIGDAIIAVDVEMNVLFMNARAQELTAWKEQEAAGHPLAEIFQLVDAKTGEPLEGAIAGSMRDPSWNPKIRQEKHQAAVIDAVLISRHGDRLPVEDNASPILDDEGRVAGGVLVFRDVSQRKQAEAEQHRNEEQLRTLANSIAHLAWMANPDGSIFWYNERWYQYTGTTAEKIDGWEWKSLHDPAMLPEVLRRWQESLDTGKPLDMEFPLRGADGKYRWFLTRVTAVKDARGKVIRWFGTNTDIHEAREIREQLQRANANLAQFAYSASHDLQEPIRNVAIFSQLLNKHYSQELDTQGTEYLGFISEGASRMETLVRDLLNYAESGKDLEALLEDVDSAEVMREVLSGLKTIVSESGAEITFSHLPTLTVRAVHLRQLFQNLIGNAIKYRGDRPPAIHITADMNGPEWIFSVKDNGIGIDAAYLDKIFVLFRRLHTSREYSGTGLGLALCRNIVELYGGRIWVSSQLGSGSTFSFSLPRRIN